MESKSIHLRLSPEIYREFESLKRNFGFTNIQELVKESMRKTLIEYRKQIAIRKISSLKGSVKGNKQLSSKDKEEIMNELFAENKKGRDILKEYGLK